MSKRAEENYIQQPTIQFQLNQWLNSQRNLGCLENQATNRKELHENGIHVLLRDGTNCVSEKCLTIATVELPQEIHRRGWFKSFLTECVKKNPWEKILIEDVKNLHLQYFLNQLNSKVLNDFYKTTYIVEPDEVLRLNAGPLRPYIFYATCNLKRI